MRVDTSRGGCVLSICAAYAELLPAPAGTVRCQTFAVLFEETPKQPERGFDAPLREVAPESRYNRRDFLAALVKAQYGYFVVNPSAWSLKSLQSVEAFLRAVPVDTLTPATRDALAQLDKYDAARGTSPVA